MVAENQGASALATPPATPIKEPLMVPPAEFQKGPQTSQGRTALQKHCDFFDRNHDGLLTPMETWEGFRALGYGLALSAFGTFLVHVFFSWWTLDTWVPDPFFTIHLKNIDRCLHGSDSHVYDQFGESRLEQMNILMARYDGAGKQGLSFTEGWAMIKKMRNAFDPFGWMAALLEWGFLWALVADERGVVSFDAIRGQYDGSLFYAIEESRKRSQ